MRTMRLRWNALGLLFVTGVMTVGAGRKVSPPMPDHFDIGRMTFFDFGPPNNYYEIYAVRSVDNKATVERITLTPAYSYGKIACSIPEKVEFASAKLDVSVETLLQSVNPCEIPERVLKREEKRCKKCLVFSGAVVNMRVQCGADSRLIPIKVREEDWFNSRAKTPQNTAWLMRLMGQLDQPLGPTVMDKPAFPSRDEGESASINWNEAVLREILVGHFDELFQDSPDTPSGLVAGARGPHMKPTVSLVSVIPIQPEEAPLPEYPKIAEAIGAEGDVSFHFTVKPNGTVADILNTVVIDAGPVSLRVATIRAVNSWKFSQSATEQVVQGTIHFALNCP